METKEDLNKKTINQEMNTNYENNEKWIESNNKLIKTNNKSDDFCIDDNNEKQCIDRELGNIENNTNNGCKACSSGGDSCQACVCTHICTQFFASGPFYAIDSIDTNDDSECCDPSMDRSSRSSKCNVLYAEMPQLSQMTLNSDDLVDNREDRSLVETSVCCINDDSHSSSSGRLVVDNGYQFVYYNYPYFDSPLNICDPEVSHNFYYLSSDESKDGNDLEQTEDNESSPPIMWKFYRNKSDFFNNNVENENSITKSSAERLSNYTTVIKPKPVRPDFSCNTIENRSHDFGNDMTNNNTLSFHSSANVLTDSDESAFTQIPRRRSNSEATHHYQCVSSDMSQMPFRRNIVNRSLKRTAIDPERFQTFGNGFGLNNNFRKSEAFSDNEFKKIERNTQNITQSNDNIYLKQTSSQNCSHSRQKSVSLKKSEPIHMTLEDVRNIFSKNDGKRCKSSTFMPKAFADKTRRTAKEMESTSIICKSKSKSKIKCAFESLFRTKSKSCSPFTSIEQSVQSLQTDPPLRSSDSPESTFAPILCPNDSNSSPFTHRALPPLPSNEELITDSPHIDKDYDRQKFLDYAASIERVKDCGWYWGPISGEMAEKLLANEPCGSFIVRDSSDEHYIFSLTFKLNGLVRHVRIEHDQGNFSFGSLQKFRSNTIVDFIENAVEHSRSGRFLFFLHRRPVMGPMRVQLLHPVSRFKQIQSLQHMCRFVILKHVRRDLIEELALPKMLKSYLNTPYYYSEELAIMNRNEETNNNCENNTSQ